MYYVILCIMYMVYIMDMVYLKYNIMQNLLTGVIIVLLSSYIWYIQYSPGTYDKVFLDDILRAGLIKSGDIVLFKAYDNFNSVFIGSYFGHMGIVYIDPDDETNTPYLFEANGIEYMPLKDHHNTNGIFISKLRDRIQKYKGRVFLKSLNKNLSVECRSEFKQFIDYSIENMSYDTSVIKSSLKKWSGLERCTQKTNCGELVFLSLLKMGLIPMSEYDTPRLNHLKWVYNLSKLQNGYHYMYPVEIIDHPFHE